MKLPRLWEKKDVLSLSGNFPIRRTKQVDLHEPVTAIGAIATAIWSALGYTAATYAAATVLATVVYVAGMAALSYGLSALGSLLGSGNRPKNSVASNGQLVNTREVTEPVKVVYGKCKVGGNWIFCRPSGTDNKNLNVCVSWSEGECEGVDKAIDSTVNFSHKTGLNDLKTNSAGTYTGADAIFRVQIDHTPGGADTFKWNNTGSGTVWNAEDVNCSTSFVALVDGVEIKFGAVTGHTIGNYWTFSAGDGVWLGESLKQYYEHFGENDVDLVNHHTFHAGTATQNYDADLVADVPSATDTYKWTCYTFFQFKYSQVAWKGVPDFFCLLKGRKLYDPRDLSTAWSRNPALVWYDFMTNSRYGMGIPSSMIDGTSVGTVATWCDDNSFYFDGCVQDRKTFLDTIGDVLSNFRAYVVYTDGKYYLRSYADDASAMSLGESDVEISPESFSMTVPGIPETPNKMKVVFADATLGYTSNFVTYEDRTQIATDGDPREMELPLTGTTSYEQAQKLAKYALLRARCNKEFTLLGHPRCYQLEPGDMVSITHTFPGWSAYKVRVKSVGIPQDGLVPVTFVDEDSDIYDLTVNATTPDSPVNPKPGPSVPSQVTGVNVETADFDNSWKTAEAVVSWTTLADEELIDTYEVRYQEKQNSSATNPSDLQDSLPGFGHVSFGHTQFGHGTISSSMSGPQST